MEDKSESGRTFSYQLQTFNYQPNLTFFNTFKGMPILVHDWVPFLRNASLGSTWGRLPTTDRITCMKMAANHPVVILNSNVDQMVSSSITAARTASAENSRMIDMPDIDTPQKPSVLRTLKGQAFDIRQHLQQTKKEPQTDKKVGKAASFENTIDRHDDTPESDSETSDPKKSRSILRNLSLRVKQLVNRLNRVTYKDVAKKVVEDKMEEVKDHQEKVEAAQQQSTQNKEMKNVKRRVYDALSVLVNSGVFLKRDKFVYPTEESRRNGKKFNKSFNEYKEMDEQIYLKEKAISEKEKILLHLVTRYSNMKAVLNRNHQHNMATKIRCADNKEREISKYLSQDPKTSPPPITRSLPQSRISWPFLVVHLERDNSKVKLFISKNKRIVVLSSRAPIRLEADMDLVSRLTLPQKYHVNLAEQEILSLTSSSNHQLKKPKKAEKKQTLKREK